MEGKAKSHEIEYDVDKFEATPIPLNEAPKEQRAGDQILILPEVVIYEHINFGGAERRTNLAWLSVGDFWNDKISSIIVVNGVWDFYEHVRYGGKKWTLGVGYYPRLPKNDVISSFKPTLWQG